MAMMTPKTFAKISRYFYGDVRNVVPSVVSLFAVIGIG